MTGMTTIWLLIALLLLMTAARSTVAQAGFAGTAGSEQGADSPDSAGLITLTGDDKASTPVAARLATEDSAASVEQPAPAQQSGAAAS